MLEINKKRLTKLQETDEWEALIAFYASYLDRLDAEEVIGTNEFTTLRNVFMKEGKKQVLKDFFDKLERQIYD